MATLNEIITDLQTIFADNLAYPPDVLTIKINDAVNAVAAGVIMPMDHSKYPGMTTPFLPDLFTIGSVTTSASAAYVAMPSNFMDRQGSLKLVIDSSGDKVLPPNGGNYHSFRLFMNRLPKKDLSESGGIWICVIKGINLYYQGKSEQTLAVQYFRKPVDMAVSADIPDGLPSHLAKKLIRHWVCKEEFGQGIEDGEDNQGRAETYHTRKFYEAATEL
ncbi:MAG: hypothetical protein L7F78_07695, partial [Syntrophales bacterium LBB04]|nr:hypothetical protein [Syntrophales bacterium LBB04]